MRIITFDSPYGEVKCYQTFDVDNNTDNIDVHLDDQYLGEINNQIIPDDEEEMHKFELCVIATIKIFLNIYS